MLLLLPPSEGKATPSTGNPLDLTTLSFPELTAPRRGLMRELGRLCRRPADARSALLLGPSQDDLLAANRQLRTAPAVPASRMYSGVLHDSIGFAALSPTARRRADGHVVVFSGLWGALRYGDRIPRYKLPIGARIGTPLAALWRGALAQPLGACAGNGLVVDLRSAPYAAAWRPSGEVAERTVVVSVLAERRVDGRVVAAPVSHFNKAAKGRFARELLLRPTDDPTALVDRADAAGLRGALTAGARGMRLDLVEPLAAP